ncbi:MAG: hypothetical protein K940chlam1_00637 [Candidatus Anoxychlamydiales bacterium]|nr:hypothetical protein [Candidatus Anoxychlamydiales bacterium]NGX36040.1 hypothetical protein [Candidatus Anoxychlamydiales bacterium]
MSGKVIGTVRSLQNYFVGAKTISTNDGSDPAQMLAKAAYVEGYGLMTLTGEMAREIYQTPALINAVELRIAGVSHKALIFGKQFPAYNERYEYYREARSKDSTEPSELEEALEQTLTEERSSLSDASKQVTEITAELKSVKERIGKADSEMSTHNKNFLNFERNQSKLKSLNLSNYEEDIHSASKKMVDLGVLIISRNAIDPNDVETLTLIDKFNTLRANLVKANESFEKLQRNYDTFDPHFWQGSHYRKVKNMGGPSVPGLNFYKRSHTFLNTAASGLVGAYFADIAYNAYGNEQKTPEQQAKETLFAAAAVATLIGGSIGSTLGYKADTTLAPKGVANLANSFVPETSVSTPIVKSIAAADIDEAKRLNKEIGKLRSEVRKYDVTIKELNSKMIELIDFEDPIEAQIAEIKGWLGSRLFETKMNRLERSDLVKDIQRVFDGLKIPNPRTELRANPVRYLNAFIMKGGFIDRADDKFDAEKTETVGLKKQALKDIDKLRDDLKALTH